MQVLRGSKRGDDEADRVDHLPGAPGGQLTGSQPDHRNGGQYTRLHGILSASNWYWATGSRRKS